MNLFLSLDLLLLRLIYHQFALLVQQHFQAKYKDADRLSEWNEIGADLPLIMGLGSSFLPLEWWKKGVYITPQRMDAYIAHLTLPTVEEDGRKKTKVANFRKSLRAGSLSKSTTLPRSSKASLHFL
jgi:hypothetical protein